MMAVFSFGGPPTAASSAALCAKGQLGQRKFEAKWESVSAVETKAFFVKGEVPTARESHVMYERGRGRRG